MTSHYKKIKDLNVSEVMTEEQYHTLREVVFLSVLTERLSNDDKRKNDESEQREILKELFGMSEQEIEDRIEGFLYYQSEKKQIEANDNGTQ
ncbi:hypothetical protein [Desmospora activa]|uniref:Uncharacterized protein n=1 Tax=Desmospora activa DSM 45169 TaxID=1121389 RepID=A0A2T4Z0Q5_9BACL|nr:hypothetical protein [Desmospora activa]PTM53321.1 hypothetical protein C8J48_3645 [Desmospora activa DSM 45169]